MSLEIKITSVSRAGSDLAVTADTSDPAVLAQAIYQLYSTTLQEAYDQDHDIKLSDRCSVALEGTRLTLIAPGDKRYSMGEVLYVPENKTFLITPADYLGDIPETSLPNYIFNKINTFSLLTTYRNKPITVEQP